MATNSPELRFWDRVAVGDDCWTWTAGSTANGYGLFTLPGRKSRLAHRIAYESLVGEIPQGLQIDHLCRNPLCVRPQHLETVTQRENIRRGNGVAGVNARKTHCIRGHAFTSSNTRVSPTGARVCRACHRDKARARWAARKENA